MAVNYTITWEEKWRDAQRPRTGHQCPRCGVAYSIDKNLSEGYQVTDNCECHKKETD